MARYAMRLRRFVLHTVLHADDDPHAIGLGVGLAMFVTFLPLVGLQTVISIGLAALFRANKAVCVPIVWITNPITLFPIYTGCWAVGRAVVPSASGTTEADVARLGEVEVGLLAPDSWKDLATQLVALGTELWVGCMIVGLVLGLLSYFLARWGVSSYRERRRQRTLTRNLLRTKGRARITRRSEVA